MRATESLNFATNAAAGTYGPLTVEGGRYLLTIKCTGTPSCQGYISNPHGDYVAVGSAITTAGGGSTELGLPPGQAEVIVGTSTANYVDLSRIPND